MVILINFNSQPFKVEYTNGSKRLTKQIPPNNIVAMKGLRVSDQISNRAFLANKNVAIFDYERGQYYHNNLSSPIGTTNLMPLLFIGDNVKPGQATSVQYGTSGTTTISGMTFTVNNVSNYTVYGFTTSANTVMANNTISATTIGNNTFISYSGGTTSTLNWYGALTASTFSGFGITITGQGATKINTGATTTFYLSANTTDVNSGFVFLQRMV